MSTSARTPQNSMLRSRYSAPKTIEHGGVWPHHLFSFPPAATGSHTTPTALLWLRLYYSSRPLRLQKKKKKIYVLRTEFKHSRSWALQSFRISSHRYVPFPVLRLPVSKPEKLRVQGFHQSIKVHHRAARLDALCLTRIKVA